MPFGRNHYVSGLEKRVHELEHFISRKGLLAQAPSATPYGLPAPVLPIHHNAQTSPADDALHTRSSSISETDAENGDSMARILRDLSLESNGGYIGATSHFSIGRLVSSIVQGKQHAFGQDGNREQINPPSTADNHVEVRLSDIPANVATKLFYGYLKHVATRYPAIQSTWLYELHNRRHRITNPYERSTLHLVYAIAGRFLETAGETGLDFVPERHQTQVLKDLDAMMHYHDTRSVVTLLLLAVYSLRAEGGPGAWAYIGLAMRIAIDLGLHRQTSSMNKVGFDVEMRKRLFWSCYTMDRQISIPLGRPFSISDREIDAALPFDVDESCQDLRTLGQAAVLDQDTPRAESTSLTAFLHILRLRRIESSIQQTIYRVDQPFNVTDTEVDYYLERLEKWKSLIPLDAKRHVDRLTLIYCAWLSPEDIYNSSVSNDINACCIVLFVITERWRKAKKYRDAFEAVKQLAIDPLSDAQNFEPRRAIVELPSVELPLDEGRREYDDIVTHMSGQQTASFAFPAGQPQAIGMEQVQYQMHTIPEPSQNEQAGVGQVSGPATSSSRDVEKTAEAMRDMDHAPSYQNSGYWPVDGVDGELDLQGGIGAFDLEGCSADMGWMSEGLG
ncbi:hypothetical protein LTR62_005279 [Meristemomyces frigidus]|uniref:Xylanolytic transcriptional activator regulatory domain-containing protein n=1 Tax=Meristemomyces frigidus TaxID=1508187 RepID=A0AAN7TFM3_9PEZI|nr:hypothetical protein LTR62_005279 [Meristemomyces frigidus]